MNSLAESLNGLGEWLVKNMIQMSIELLILTALVAAIIMIFKIKSPALRHLFCCLILAKPVVTFLIASPISLYWFLHPLPEPEPASVVNRVSMPAIPRTRPAVAAFRPGPVRTNTVTISAPEPFFLEAINSYGICTLIWLTISSILFIRFIAGFIYICIIRKRARRLQEGELYSILQSVSKEIKTFPRTNISVTTGDCGPVLAGIISPLILMPEKLLKHLSTAQLRLIIAHELMHVKRMDNLVLVIQRLAEIFLFFHPVVWLCGKVMRNDAEAACDNAVLALYGNSADYVESLLRVAEAREKLSRRLLINTFAAAESDFIKRVKRIARGKPVKMTFGTIIFSAITIIFIGGLGLPGSAERKLENAKISNLKTGKENKMKKVSKMNKKIIDEVPVISWGKPGTCSYAAALEAAFKVTKHPYSYNEIMGDSALAFRVRWRGLKCKKDGPWWCGSIPVAEFPDVTARISEQTGWKFKETGMLEKEPEKIKEYIPEVIESINKGWPVVGYPTGKQLDCATIYGYEIKDGKVYFYWRNLYTGAKENIAPADNTGPWLLFLESWKKAPPAKKRFINALKQSVINWSRTPSGDPAYYTWSYGKEALEIWIDDLKKAEKYTDKERGELFFVNAWNFGTMRDARKNAVKYLEANIKLVPEKAGKKLNKALKLYKEEIKLFKANPDVFKGPMHGKKVVDWTSANRQRELKIMQKTLKLENQAINLIREGLEAMEVDKNSVVSPVNTAED